MNNLMSRDRVIVLLSGVFILCIVIFLSLYIFHFSQTPQKITYPVAVTNKIVSLSKSLSIPPVFYGVDVDMSQLLPTSRQYVKNSNNEDLIDIAHHLGINIFRITGVGRSFDDGSDEQLYTRDQWGIVLNKMASNNIWAVILIETPSKNSDLYKTEINNSYLDLVKKYIILPQVPSFENVYGIDIKNEPLLDINNLSYLKEASHMIKEKFPKTRITVGGWTTDAFRLNNDGTEQYNWQVPSDIIKMQDFVDFYSPHIYGFDKKSLATFFAYPDPYNLAQSYFEKLLQYSQNKPILPDEFGATNGDSVSDQETIGSPQLQANAYNGMYQAVNSLKSRKVLGVMSYLYMSRDHRNDSWAIIKDNGNYIYPAAYVLQKYATGKSDIPLSLPYTTLPNDILLTNNLNNTTQTINVGDIVGIDLTLPQAQYVLSVNNPTSLSTTESFQYYSAIKKYNAVFHAVKPGTTTVIVSSNHPCLHQPTLGTCVEKTAVFSTTIIVH